MKKASLFFAFVSMLVISSLSSFAQQLVINSLVPSSGAIGDQVTITGSGFRDTQAPQSVGFNGIIAPVVSWSDTIIVVMVPTGVPLGDASVSVKGPRGFGFSNAVTFSVKPGVGQLSPSVGPVGAPVTVAGTNFGDSQGSSTITLGGVSLTPSQWTDPQISVTVPAGFPAGSAELVVTVNGLSSAPQPLLVIPVIISDSPAEASVGTPATLTGSSFGGQQGQSTLTFNGVPAIPSAWSDTSITAPVPVGATTGPLVVTVNGLATNGLPFNVQPKITSLGPASGAVNSLVTITGTTFGQTQGFGSVTFNGLNAVVQSWSDSAISVFVPPNATTGNIVVTTGILLTSNGVNFAVINPLAVGPGIQLSISDTPLQINLTSPQVLDWIHWGRVSTTVPDRKDGIAPLISDFTALSGSQATTSSGNIAFSWTDGNHPAQVSEATEDIKTFTTGGGFLITVPADTTVKTLNLYAEVIAGQGILHASLSDGSAADINDQTVVDSDIGNKVYSVDFRAASAGQTLTVSFSGTASTSGVGLQAATLTPHLPTVMIGAPATAQQFVAPGSIPVNISADQFGSSISDVKATGSEGTVLDNAGSPLNSNLGPLAGGHYSVTGTAIDTTGLIGTSTPVEFDVIGQGGTLSIDEVPPSSPIDLDTEGSGDWILWGSGSGNIYARKSGVGPLISNYKPIGNHPITSLLGAHNLCFSGDQQSYCTDEVTVHGQGNGFEITVAADTTPRTLQLYVGRLSADGLVTAFLSDGSAPVATEVGGVGPPESSTTLYTINFSAASAGQTLTVRFTLNSDQGNGQISLIGAAVNGNSVAPLGPAPQITAISPNSAPANTKVTIAGSNFGATQGTGGVYFGELNAQIVNWSDTSLDAMVPAGLGDGSSAQVVVITPNGTSNPVSFHVAAFQVYPPSLSIVVGQSGLVTPKDSSHNVVSGLNWFTTDPSIVSVSADDPAIITGLAPGIATVYAGDVPFQVTVYAGASLPPGTALWSVPLSPGATQITSVVPAVPGDSGADVLALDDARNLSAYSSDGELLWTQPVPVCLGAALPNCAFTKVFPDFSGNIFISQISDIFRTTKMDNSISPPKLLTFSHLTQTISKLNIQTGQLTDFYTFQGADEGNGSGNFVDSPSDRAIPSPAGVLFIQDVPKVTVFDPATAQPIVTIDLERTTFANGAPDQDPVSGQMIVAGDGNAYVPYIYTTQDDAMSLCTIWFFGPQIPPVAPEDRSTTAMLHTPQIVNNVMVLRVSPDGSFAKIRLNSFTQNESCVNDDPGPPYPSNPFRLSGSGYPPPSPFPFAPPRYNLPIITNADQGVAVIWPQPDDTQLMNLISNDSVSPPINVPSSFQPVLQREDGSYIGTDADKNLLAIALDGTSLWSTKINPDANGNGTPVHPLYATADGGTIVTSTDDLGNGDKLLGTLFTLDPSGNVTGQTQDLGVRPSWTGESYSPSGASLTSVYVPLVYIAGASFWPQSEGNPSGTGTAIVQCPCLLQTAGSAQGFLPLRRRPAYQARVRNVSFVALQSPAVDNKKYILLPGDPGLNTIDAQGHPHNHSVGNLFNLAAQTKARDLANAGAVNVVTNRVSSFDDFSNALTTNGLIDGEIMYFGHAGVDGEGRSALFPGQTAGIQTNITSVNIGSLSNAHLGRNVTITLNACHAGYGGARSVANQIALKLNRTVFAYPVDMYFSSDPTPRRFNPKTMIAPGGVPTYMVPNADGMQPTQFPLK